MHPHTKFGIPTSKNVGDMDRTQKRDGQTDGRTEGRTVRLLYASQSSLWGIKNNNETNEKNCSSIFDRFMLSGNIIIFSLLSFGFSLIHGSKITNIIKMKLKIQY